MTCQTTDVRTWVRGSVDYLTYDVTADVELGDQDVAITFDRTALIPATWIGTDTENDDHTHTRPCRTVNVISDDDLPAGISAEVFIKITDNPAIPFIDAGTITFI
jgi:hypothetical protein